MGTRIAIAGRAQRHVRRLVAQADDAHLGDLHDLVGKGVAVEGFVLLVEALEGALEVGRFELQRTEGHELTEVLTQVAHTQVAGDLGLAFETVAREFLGGFLVKLAELAVQEFEVDPVRAVHHGSRAIDAEFGQERPEGGQEPRVGRDHDLGHPEVARHIDRVERPRPTEGDEGERAVVDAAVDGHQPNRVGHVLRRGVEDGERRLLATEADLFAEGIDRALGGRGVEAHLPTEEECGIEAPEDDVGIRDGGLASAASVARRSRFGAGAAWPDAQETAGVDIGDRTPAGADRRVVDEERAHRDTPLDLVLGGRPELAVGDEPDIAARAPHVEGDAVPARVVAREAAAGDDAAREPREQELHRHLGRGRRLDVTPVRLHQRERCRDSHPGEGFAEPADEAFDDPLREGVRDRRGGPLVLAPDGAHAVGEGDREVGENDPPSRSRPPLRAPGSRRKRGDSRRPPSRGGARG